MYKARFPDRRLVWLWRTGYAHMAVTLPQQAQSPQQEQQPNLGIGCVKLQTGHFRIFLKAALLLLLFNECGSPKQHVPAASAIYITTFRPRLSAAKLTLKDVLCSHSQIDGRSAGRVSAVPGSATAAVQARQVRGTSNYDG